MEKGITSVWTSIGITSSPFVPAAERIRGRGGEDSRVVIKDRISADPTPIETPTALLKFQDVKVVIYKLANFIDGKRSISDIRDAVSAEFRAIRLPVVIDYFERLAKQGRSHDQVNGSLEHTMDGQLNPERILQTGLAFWPSKTLLSAIEFGVFSELARGAQPLDSLSNASACTPARRGIFSTRSSRSAFSRAAAIVTRTRRRRICSWTRPSHRMSAAFLKWPTIVCIRSGAA